MADIVFEKRPIRTESDYLNTPRLGWIFQDKQPGLLFNGRITVDDGFAKFTRADGTTVITTYGVLRPYSFFRPEDPYQSSAVEPGFLGLKPLNFRLGRVGVRRPETRVLLLTHSPTFQWTGGRLKFATTSTLGSLTQFSIWGAGQSDPKDFYITSATDIDSGTVTNQYVRMNAIFTPRRNTRYLGVGARVYSVPNTGTYRTHYFKKWMVETSEVTQTGPSAKYGKAREVIVKVKPDRLNYFTNPGFEVDVTGMNGGAGSPTRATTTAQKQFGNNSLLLTSTVAGANLETYWNTGQLLPADWWTISWYVYTPIARTCYAQFEKSGVYKKGPEYRVPPGQWTRCWYTFQNPTRQTFNIYFSHVADSSQAIGATLYLDGFLLERGRELGAYFDGSWSADTMWEVGGATGKARSYLYKNKAERYAAIKRVLTDNVPLGIGIADPVLGTLPAD